MGIRRLRQPGRPAAHKPLALLDFLEPRRLFAATPAGTYAFGGKASASVTDGDGTVATFALPAGQGVITVADDGWHVAVSRSTPAASLSITTAGGDGRVTLAGFAAAKPLGSINAPKANLSGSLNLTNVKSVTLGNLSDLSLTTSSPLASLTAASWSDSTFPPDTLTAPSIAVLNIKGNFAPAVTLSSKKVALNSATVGGTVSGAWSVAGSAGTLKFHAVRSPDLTIAGNVTQLSLDDYVAVAPVATDTGGVLHFGGTGAVSAAKGKDKFQVAKGVTLYTCAADMYTWSDLYQYDRLGRSWTYSTNGKRQVSTVLRDPQKVNGYDAIIVQDTGADPGTEAYYVDSWRRGHALQFTTPHTTYVLNDLVLGPRVYRLGDTTTDHTGSNGHIDEADFTAGLHGTASISATFVGHELVTTPAGSFVAVELRYTLFNNYFDSAASSGGRHGAIFAKVTVAATDYVVPGIGLVKSDQTTTVTIGIPPHGPSQTQRLADHMVLTALPTDSA